MTRPPPGRVRKVVDWIVGLTLILIGIVGAFVPLLQGWIFVLAGLAVLSSHSRWARAVLNTLKRLGHRLRERFARRARSADAGRESWPD